MCCVIGTIAEVKKRTSGSIGSHHVFIGLLCKEITP
jgi:hypothetical protein